MTRQEKELTQSNGPSDLPEKEGTGQCRAGPLMQIVWTLPLLFKSCQLHRLHLARLNRKEVFSLRQALETMVWRLSLMLKGVLKTVQHLQR